MSPTAHCRCHSHSADPPSSSWLDSPPKSPAAAHESPLPVVRVGRNSSVCSSPSVPPAPCRSIADPSHHCPILGTWPCLLHPTALHGTHGAGEQAELGRGDHELTKGTLAKCNISHGVWSRKTQPYSQLSYGHGSLSHTVQLPSIKGTWCPSQSL